MSYEDKYFQIGKSLQIEGRVEMLLSLVQNFDIFAWSPFEVPGVDLTFITHMLNVGSLFPSRRQKPRRSAIQHLKAVKEEEEWLKQAGEIKEVFFPEWLLNTVVVENKN